MDPAAKDPFLWNLPPSNGTETSNAAAKDIAPKTPSMREKIFALVKSSGDCGITCDEVEILTGLKHQTASARLYELCRGGKVTDSGERRRTSSGSLARVYVVDSNGKER